MIPQDGCRGQRQNTSQWGNQGKCCEMVKKPVGTNKISCSQFKIYDASVVYKQKWCKYEHEIV